MPITFIEAVQVVIDLVRQKEELEAIIKQKDATINQLGSEIARLQAQLSQSQVPNKSQAQTIRNPDEQKIDSVIRGGA